MVYIPFIYFTLMLVWCWHKYHTIGIGFVSIAWVDISSLFAIVIDARGLYGTMGVNDYAITPIATFIYCFLWTIALLPIAKLDDPDFSLSVRKSQLFTLLCLFICLMVGIQLVFGDFVELLQNGLKLSGAENYDLAKEAEQNYQGRGKYWLWIPTIVSNGFPLILLCWFISLTICPQRKWVTLALILLSTTKMIIGLLSGGRAQIIWWMITFLMLFAFFRRFMSNHHRVLIRNIFIALGSLALVGFLSITFSRFDDSTDYAIDSLVGYAGQTFNNFCAFLPYSEIYQFRFERTFPLLNLLTHHHHVGLLEYYDMLENEFPIYMSVFFPFFGSAIIDLGWIGISIIYVLYLMCYRYLVLPDRGTNIIDFSSLVIMAVLTGFISQGLFHYPFAYHENTAYAIFSLLLYFIFKYNYKVRS